MANYMHSGQVIGDLTTYRQNENGFVATGTYYTDAGVHYTAAHPYHGLWICGSTLDNTPVVIGFISWDNIKRIVIDDKTGAIFIVVKNFQTILNNAGYKFRNLYKNTFSHQMKDTGDMAICINKELCTGGILPYLQQRFPLEYKHEEVKTSVGTNIFLIVALALGAFAVLATIFG